VSAAKPRRYDIGSILDDGPWTGAQVSAFAYLNALRLAMIVVTVALATLRHHIAPVIRRVTVQAA
jgi:hypothetical protein